MQSSNIATIIDYTAAMAAGIPGMQAVAASGQGVVDDPLRPGQKIATAPAAPSTPFTHWSEVPGAPAVMWVSQSGTVELTWTIPMRLWLPKTDEDARRTAMPFYDHYLRAFVSDPFLGAYPDNLALRSELTGFSIGGDKDWSWLDVRLVVVERVNYGAS